jgi:hypothetical protein
VGFRPVLVEVDHEVQVFDGHAFDHLVRYAEVDDAQAVVRTLAVAVEADAGARILRV